MVKEERIGTEYEELERFFGGLGAVTVAYEASTNYEYFYETLVRLGCEVRLSHPLKTRLIAESKRKTDKVDAHALADLLRANLLPLSYVPPKEIRMSREMVRHRQSLGRHRAKLKNHIHAHLLRRNLKYDGPNVFTKAGIEWLRGLKIPWIDSYLAIYDAVEREIKRTEEAIAKEGASKDDVQLLLSIPGIGNYSALMISSEIGDINRFPTEEKLFAYAGLVPSIHQSGETSYHGGITKEGASNLRWILVEAIHLHTHYAPKTNLSRFYQRMRKKKPGQVATIAAARKLLQIIYHMLKRREEFRGQGYGPCGEACGAQSPV